MNKKGNWEVTIRKVNNGFICEYEEELVGETGFRKEEVLFESNEYSEDELETMKNVLWWIKDYFGIYHSKHNEKNLDIEVK